MLNPVAMWIIPTPSRSARAGPGDRGVGRGGGGQHGARPVVGGALVSSVGWRSIFWINVPIGLAACLLGDRYVPESRAPRPVAVDPVGQLLVVVLLAALTFGIIEGPRAGRPRRSWRASPSPPRLSSGSVLYEPRRNEPLLELRFFRSVPFSGAT